ncbi:hypothetical protein PA598K_04195 [Paenibacillus sp. 598K]|uniref:XkdQ/YqbQ family protein n=1 Tax=Paenibacillus sp. 598K TaxID=1117987 RepID=UPI000FF9581D|nr:hypothetical protein [Paenibacillus sp. 598K]GBF75764.1 hypothetical protein PA598K_04195 [Paenibacillus sp. 598K]
MTIDNRSGTRWDVTSLVPELNWKTMRVGKAGVCDFRIVRTRSLQASEQFPVNCGDTVQVWYEENCFFQGYIFTVEEDQERVVKVTAFDQIRYLMESDTYVKKNITATQVIKDNALAVGRLLGPIADTKYVIPKFSMDGQKRLDMICKALDETLMADGSMFIFYDDAGLLTLRNVTDMKVNLILGENSLVYGYSTSRDIDSNTYNRVKLVRDNKESGKREAFIEQDSDTIAMWGRLQFWQKVDEGLNEEQIKAMAHRIMQLKNRQQRSFNLDAIGYISVRAGSILQVTMPHLNLDRNFLVEECNHKFAGQTHTMKLELNAYEVEMERL